ELLDEGMEQRLFGLRRHLTAHDGGRALDGHARRQRLEFQARGAFGCRDFSLCRAFDFLRFFTRHGTNALRFGFRAALGFRLQARHFLADAGELRLRLATQLLRAFAGAGSFRNLPRNLLGIRAQGGRGLQESPGDQHHDNGEIDPAKHPAGARLGFRWTGRSLLRERRTGDEQKERKGTRESPECRPVAPHYCVAPPRTGEGCAKIARAISDARSGVCRSISARAEAKSAAMRFFAASTSSCALMRMAFSSFARSSSTA